MDTMRRSLLIPLLVLVAAIALAVQTFRVLATESRTAPRVLAPA